MLEEKEHAKIEGPRFVDLRDLATYILKRRAEILKELVIIEQTLQVISKTTGLKINLNGNTIEEH